jgi:hypothetical protein
MGIVIALPIHSKLRKCSYPLWFYIVHIRYFKFELASEVRTKTTISKFRHAGNKMYLLPKQK